MHILIIGAAGMIGRKLTRKFCDTQRLGNSAIDRITLVDVVAPDTPTGFVGTVDTAEADLSDPGTIERFIETRPDIIYHLAAIVSGEAETDFSKGYRTNLGGTLNLFEAIRKEGERQHYKPRVIFTSSIAVFGTPLPPVVPDEFVLTPLTSYGTQKAVCELLLSDYTRRGFFDGIGIRLPTICIRPGKPNKAASGFFSGILREPLAGQEAILPVPLDIRHWFASPRAAVGFLTYAGELDLTQLGTRRNLNMPGISATVGDEIEALRRFAGDKAVKLVRQQLDESILRIVHTWPQEFDPKRALALGFKSDPTFDDIIRAHVEDELDGKIQS